jgi:hypothetical protein
MRQLRQRMIEDMRLRNFSSHRKAADVRAVAQFTKHFMLPPRRLQASRCGGTRHLSTRAEN